MDASAANKLGRERSKAKKAGEEAAKSYEEQELKFLGEILPVFAAVVGTW
jgi:hypothetical protein